LIEWVALQVVVCGGEEGVGELKERVERQLFAVIVVVVKSL
jgi:hypothetical protein